MTPPNAARQIEGLLAVCNFLKFSLAGRLPAFWSTIFGSTEEEEIAEEDADLLYGGLLRNQP